MAPGRLTSSAALHFTEADTRVTDGTGLAPPPDRLDADLLQGAWTPVALPHVMDAAMLPEGRGAGGAPSGAIVNWYRLAVPPRHATQAAQRYVYIPRVKGDGKVAVYSDRRLLYRSDASLIWNGWNHPLWILLSPHEGAPLPAHIYVRIERPSWARSALSTVWVGTDQDIGWRYRTRVLLQIQLPYMVSVAFLTLGLFSLAARIRLGRGALYLITFMISVVACVRSIHYYVGQERLIVSDDWFLWITVSSLFWLVGLSHFFLVRLHGQPHPWFNKIVVIACTALTVVTFPNFMQALGLPQMAALTPVVYFVGLGLMVAVSCFGFASARATGSRDALLVSSWCLLGLACAIFDWLLQNNHVGVEAIHLGPYANNCLFLMFMYILFRRYMGAIDDVRQLNASLETRLQARESELNTTHARLREAERREERQRLMRDMHDGLGSSLISALRRVQQGGLSDATVAQILKDCVDDLKLAIDSMEPVEADLLLLLATLRFRLAPRLEGTGIALRWQAGRIPALAWLDPSHSLHILRIFQEAFANILKHTQADEIRLTTAVQGGWVSVTIADNGAGFDTGAARHHGGRGLSNQQHRARMLGGELQVVSGGTGTQVTLRLPVDRPTPR